MSHFYDKEGKLVSEVPNKSKGGYRPTTLSDARKLGLVPSVTTIIGGVTNKDWLVNWKLGLLDEYLSKNPKPTDRSLASLVEELSSGARDFGTEVHRLMEIDAPGTATIKREFLMRFPKAVQTFAEGSFADDRGFGGTIDLRILEDDGTINIIDYKTTKSIDGAKSTDYERQLCFYAMHHLKTKINPNVKTWILWIEVDEKKKLITGKWKLDLVDYSKQVKWCELALGLYKEGNNI